MGKYIYLMKVEADANNNKYYEMVENDGGMFTAKWGRVGSNPQTKDFPMRDWDKKYKSKTKKGYNDITEMISKVKKESGLKDISDSLIADIMSFLLQASSSNVAENYMVKADSVTQKQVDEAQGILDTVAKKLNVTSLKNETVDEINSELQKLFTVIPRKMKKVKDHLLSDTDLDVAKRLLTTEQDNLDSMAASVQMNAVTDELSDEEVEEKTILDILGVSIERVTSDEERVIKKELGDIKDKYYRAIKVTHHKSRKLFEENVESSSNKKTELLWHGSRNENFIGILQKSLLIRPSGAVYTGSMFGDGIYFANKARKSYGYTSGRGSYWARGNSNKAFMALFEVHLGNEYHIKHHSSECYKFSADYLAKKGGYDSVFAHGGADLRNDEKIVYRSNQTTIKYLVELRG